MSSNDSTLETIALSFSGGSSSTPFCNRQDMRDYPGVCF